MNNPSKISGELTFAGDKSLSHRAAILAGMAEGESRIENFLPAGDTLNTLKAMIMLGAVKKGDSDRDFRMVSPGITKWKLAPGTLDLGNSGTGSRLLMGMLCGIPGMDAVIDGDESLRKRPMRRITGPLTALGAEFDPVDQLPIHVRGRKILPVIHTEDLGSAQVKSALIFAALSSGVSLRLEEKKASRDHTENMLDFCGVEILREEAGEGFVLEMEPPYRVKPGHFKIWGDISSASFFVVLALLMKEGELRIRDVLLNPYRDHYLNVLKRMGGDIEVIEKDTQCGERGGDILVRPSVLVGTSIEPWEIPSVIDELPILTIAGAFAQGEFTFHGAKELRVKESDRITAMVENLASVGIQATEFEDGLQLKGDPLRVISGEVDSHMDHRIAMSFEIANLASLANTANGSGTKVGGVQIRGKEWISTSFPDFYKKLDIVLGRLDSTGENR